MYIVYDTQTHQGIKQYKDRRHGEQFANKLNIGAGTERYKCVDDQKFYQSAHNRSNKLEVASWK